MATLPIVFTGCHRSDNQKTNIVGYLGKIPVTLKDLTDTARFMGLGSLSGHPPSEWPPPERKAVLLETVQNILLKEAGQKRGIKVHTQDVLQYLQNHFHQPDNDLSEFVRKVLFIRKTEESLAPVQNETLSDERSFYRDHPSLFQVSRQAIVDHIVVAKQEEAESIRNALIKGSSFSKLARLESLGTEASSGGRMQAYTRGTMPPPFDTVFTLKPGAISDVLSSPYGYHIFRLKKFVPKHTVPFSLAKKWILKTLVRKKREYLLNQWLTHKLQKTPFRIAPDYEGIFSPVPVTIFVNSSLSK